MQRSGRWSGSLSQFRCLLPAATARGGLLLLSMTVFLVGSVRTAVPTEFQVNTSTIHDQFEPAVAVDATGNFVVVWEAYYEDGDDLGIFGRR